MLKWVIATALIVGIVSSVISHNREAELQASRNLEQAALLAQLERINTPVVSQLVDDWRTAYPAPSDEKLTELKVVTQRVKNNPATAAEFTKEAKQKSAAKFNAAFSAPFAGEVKADGPGL